MRIPLIHIVSNVYSVDLIVFLYIFCHCPKLAINCLFWTCPFLTRCQNIGKMNPKQFNNDPKISKMFLIIFYVSIIFYILRPRPVCLHCIPIKIIVMDQFDISFMNINMHFLNTLFYQNWTIKDIWSCDLKPRRFWNFSIALNIVCYEVFIHTLSSL